MLWQPIQFRRTPGGPLQTPAHIDPSAHLDPVICSRPSPKFLPRAQDSILFPLPIRRVCMLEVAGDSVKTFPMDHHGLIASVCKDLKIAERINACLDVRENRVVSPGHAVVALILNGLGFTNRRLYLTPQFFESKPVERLLGVPIQASDLNDYTLGHTLDEISQYGASNMFGTVAFGIAMENNLLGKVNHLDSTSISVTGEYASPGFDTPEPATIQLMHGHSKDLRPDLKQAVLSLVVNGPSNMPIWMEALSGNSSDKVSFHETIRKVKAFQKQLDISSDAKWVADSALYTADKLLANPDYLWLTRVPETVGEARDLVSRPDTGLAWVEQEGGYKFVETDSSHGGIAQRWLLVYSEQAYVREKKTLERNLEKKEALLKKEIWHLGNKEFGCEKDAENEVLKLAKQYPLYHITCQVIPILKHDGKGKPAAGAEPRIKGYKVDLMLERNESAVEDILTRKGRFILATNDLDRVGFTSERMLAEYKEQQNVEGGFRFLKDPWFMVDSVFLKSAHRIESLMMVMTLCLLVYNVAQYSLRKRLVDTGDTLPNQLNKEVQNPTLRWIFQIMEGMGVLHYFEGEENKLIREMVTNMSPLRRKIIQLFGPTACEMHGVNPKSGA